MKRQDILNQLYDIDGQENRQSFIYEVLDDIESKVKEIRCLLDINDISDIANINDAFDLVDELAKELY